MQKTVRAEIVNRDILAALEVHKKALGTLIEQRTADDAAAIEARKVAAGGEDPKPESTNTLPKENPKKPEPHFSINQDPDGTFSIHENGKPTPVMAGLTESDANNELPELVKNHILENGSIVRGAGGTFVLYVPGVGSSESFASEAEARAAQEKAKNPTAATPAAAEAAKTGKSPAERRAEILANLEARRSKIT